MIEGLRGLRDAATEIGVPITWLRKEAREGRVPCLKAGRRILFDLPTLAESLRQRAAGKAVASV